MSHTLIFTYYSAKNIFSFHIFNEVMIERDNGQAALSTLLVMSSAKYRWNIKFTEIYYREIDAIGE